MSEKKPEDGQAHEQVDVFKLQHHHNVQHAKKSESTEVARPASLNPVAASSSSDRSTDINKPLPEDEGRTMEDLDAEIDQRRIAMRDAFRKLLGQKLGSIYVTNHQERKAKPKLPYYVRVNPNVIDYREVMMGRKVRFTYNFNTGECKYETKILKQYAIRRFFKKLDQVSEDITNKVALVYEEPKKAGA